MTDEVPPGVVALADQAYAEAQTHLDEMIVNLCEDMSDRQGTSDSMYWASSWRYLVGLQKRAGEDFTRDLLAMLTAAIYRLARQREQ